MSNVLTFLVRKPPSIMSLLVLQSLLRHSCLQLSCSYSYVIHIYTCLVPIFMSFMSSLLFLFLCYLRPHLSCCQWYFMSAWLYYLTVWAYAMFITIAICSFSCSVIFVIPTKCFVHNLCEILCTIQNLRRKTPFKLS